MFVLGLLYLVKNNRRGLLLTYVIMTAGGALIGVVDAAVRSRRDRPDWRG